MKAHYETLKACQLGALFKSDDWQTAATNYCESKLHAVFDPGNRIEVNSSGISELSRLFSAAAALENSRKQENERRSADEKAAAHKQASEMAVAHYRDCVNGTLEAMAITTSEPADTIVLAAFGACQQVGLEIVAAEKMGPLGQSVTIEFLDEINSALQPRLLNRVIQFRAAMQNRSGNPAAPPNSTPPPKGKSDGDI